VSLMLHPRGQRQLIPSKLGNEQKGFTLLEILVVLALLSLIVSMVPSGLMGLNERANHQLLAKKVVVAARQCSITAQQQQRSIGLGSESCPLPTGTAELTVNAESLPLFHADGTASHTAQIIIGAAATADRRATVVTIDTLTANVSLQNSAQ
jgi:prepilin-type N-terminal cleavage/methylation domain-containing protein